MWMTGVRLKSSPYLSFKYVTYYTLNWMLQIYCFASLGHMYIVLKKLITLIHSTILHFALLGFPSIRVLTLNMAHVC